MKKIMILYASVGGGHFRAAEGVRDYLEKYFKEECEVKLIDGLNYVNKAVDKIVISSYVNMAKYSPKIWSKMYKIGEEHNSLNQFSNGVQRILSLKLYELFEEFNPDIVVSTHYFLTEMVACIKRRKKTSAKLAVILTDYAPHKFWESSSEEVDLYFVANEQMKYILKNDGIEETKIYVTGIPVRPEFLEKYDRDFILEDLNLSKDKKTFLIFGGGQYGMSNISSIFKELLNVSQDIQIIFVAGKTQSLQNKIKKLSESSNKKVVILGYTNRVAELMSVSDFVISKPGGLTTTEILTMNIPFIIINPVPGQEEENSAFLTNNGAGIRLYSSKNATPIFEHLIKDDFRINQMKIMQKYIAKPNSTKEIVETILNKL